MEAVMKSSLFKYFFATIFVGFCGVLYQTILKKPATDRFVEILDFQKNQIKHQSGKNIVDRAARIKKLEEMEPVSDDLDIPISFEQFDQPVRHLPAVKSNKVSVVFVDPNAASSIDRSNTAMFAQGPVASETYQAPAEQYFDPYSNFYDSQQQYPLDHKKKKNADIFAKKDEPALSGSSLPLENNEKNLHDRYQNDDANVKHGRNDHRYGVNTEQDDFAVQSSPTIPENNAVGDTVSTEPSNVTKIAKVVIPPLLLSAAKKIWDWYQKWKNPSENLGVDVPGLPDEPLKSLQPEDIQISEPKDQERVLFPPAPKPEPGRPWPSPEQPTQPKSSSVSPKDSSPESVIRPENIEILPASEQEMPKNVNVENVEFQDIPEKTLEPVRSLSTFDKKTRNFDQQDVQLPKLVEVIRPEDVEVLPASEQATEKVRPNDEKSSEPLISSSLSEPVILNPNLVKGLSWAARALGFAVQAGTAFTALNQARNAQITAEQLGFNNAIEGLQPKVQVDYNPLMLPQGQQPPLTFFQRARIAPSTLLPRVIIP